MPLKKRLLTSTKVLLIARITLALCYILSVSASCKKSKTPIEDRAVDAQDGYSMYTKDANILVSDSGITQYHILAEAWYIYEEGEDAHWFFPKGFYGEQVDSLMSRKAMLRSDTAYYYTNRGQWLFIGNVNVENLSGDQFLAKSLLWDSDSKMVSSEDSVTVISEDRRLSGTSFQADQNFSRYVFLNNSGVVNVPDEDDSSQGSNVLE